MVLSVPLDDMLDDAEFIDRVPAGVLRAFRDKVRHSSHSGDGTTFLNNHNTRWQYTNPDFVKANSTAFLGTGWVNIPLLRAFLRDIGNTPDTAFLISSSPPPSTPPAAVHHVRPTPIKDEPEPVSPSFSTKVELDNTMVEIDGAPPSTKTRTLQEKGKEVLEILSSDDEIDMGDSSDWQTEFSQGEGDIDDIDMESDDEFVEPKTSETDWQDPKVTSKLIAGWTRVTRQMKVEHVEYLTEIPSLWPVPRQAVAYVVDLCDTKFDVFVNGKTPTADGLIRDKV